MKTVIISDIYPGAEFRQDGSTNTLVVDSIKEEGVFFYTIDDETKTHSQTMDESFETFIYVLNVAGYHKIN